MACASEVKSKVSKNNDVVIIDSEDDNDFKPMKSISSKSASSKARPEAKVLKKKANSKTGNLVCEGKLRERKVNNISGSENVDSSSSSSISHAKVVNNDNGKDAWKGLMQQMQINQKKISSAGGNVSKKLKPSFKRELTQSPQQKKGNESTSKVARSPLKKLPRLENAPEKVQKRDYSDIVDICENTEKEKVAAVEARILSSDHTSERSTKPLAPIFLSPTERKAQLLQGAHGSPDKATGTGQLLNSIVVSSNSSFDHAEEPGLDDPNHFNGNVVLLNQDMPAGNPYEGNKTKQCPFYKKLPGTSFCVDAFNYGLVPGMEVYFLSHFHSDHYIGLSKKFCKTLICSRPTGNLVRLKLYVTEKCIRKLRMNKPYIICDSEVTLIDANHCPGSVMFVFRLKTGQMILHTGDFRYTPNMLHAPVLSGRRIDCLYLDTTYCSPQYDFPTQCASVSTAVSHVKKHMDYRPKTLILCGSYLIGKERVYMTLAEAIDSKVFVSNDKRKIINALENSKFSDLITTNENEAVVHVVPMFSISAKNLHEYLMDRPKYTNIVGIKPNGWQFSSCGSGCSVKTHYGDTVTVLGIPYSEHSSFSELKEFVSTLKPKRVQPTVNVGNAKKRGEMMQHIENWIMA